MNTNFLKTVELAKAFYEEGAFVQTEADLFKVFVGPFKKCASLQEAQSLSRSQNEPILYSSKFWGFLDSKIPQFDYFLPHDSFSCSRDQFLEFTVKNDDIIDNIDWQKTIESGFKQQYDWIQKHISLGQIKKALPIAVAEGVGNFATRLPSVINKIANQKTVNYSYGFWNQNSGMIGYTPEVLSSWKKNNSELETMALAGTWRKNLNHEVIDFSDQKIRQEHNYVIEDIKNQLNHFKKIHQSETTVVELPYLYHLKTQFNYFCDSAESFMQAIRLLHPTAALGLYPRDMAMAQEFSKINIQKTRHQFGAPLGWVSSEEGFVLVAIRNIMWDQNKLKLYAGCGVTGDSIYQDEWQEILAKQESVKKMLGAET